MQEITAVVVLKASREKPVRNRHPWVFSGAIERVQGSPAPGDIVDVISHDGRFLARAYYNPHSQIRARILSWDPDEKIDDDFWRAKISRALVNRVALQLEPTTTAFRLVNAEADGLPGLVVDKYGDFLVIQCLTLGIDRRKQKLIALLADLARPSGIVERSDVPVRQKEGLNQTKGLCWGEPPPENLIIHENSLKFGVDLLAGHKTGLYLDQRENRRHVCHKRNVVGKEILNMFAYTGGFAVNASAGGAGSITNIDSSAEMLVRAENNVALNASNRQGDEYIVGDAFEVLRYYRDTERRFDMVILDPPKFAHSQRGVKRAARGYKDLNWLALRLLRAGGLLATFSCSGRINPELFQKIVFGAAIDANRDVQIIQRLGQAPDHPILLTFPESAYLKGLLCRVW
jgi:23S rRNA (cytosine1962-C5)-methyltransferase